MVSESGSMKERVMKKKVLEDNFGIAMECLSIDARERCWNSSSAMNSIWGLGGIWLDGFAASSCWELERWLHAFASCWDF